MRGTPGNRGSYRDKKSFGASSALSARLFVLDSSTNPPIRLRIDSSVRTENPRAGIRDLFQRPIASRFREDQRSQAVPDLAFRFRIELRIDPPREEEQHLVLVRPQDAPVAQPFRDAVLQVDQAGELRHPLGRRSRFVVGDLGEALVDDGVAEGFGGENGDSLLLVGTHLDSPGQQQLGEDGTAESILVPGAELGCPFVVLEGQEEHFLVEEQRRCRCHGQLLDRATWVPGPGPSSEEDTRPPPPYSWFPNPRRARWISVA